jgi:hypothetical protein
MTKTPLKSALKKAPSSPSKGNISFKDNVEEAFIGDKGEVRRGSAVSILSDVSGKKKQRMKPTWRDAENQVLDSDLKKLDEQKQAEPSVKLSKEEILEETISKTEEFRQKELRRLPGSADPLTATQRQLYNFHKTRQTRYKEELSNISEVARETKQNTEKANSIAYKSATEKRIILLH